MNSKNNRKSIRWIVAAALAVVLCVCICFGAACSKTNDGAVGKRTYFNKVDPASATPEEGYDGNDYVNYIAYVLEQQDEWYAVSDSQAKASVNSQQIWTDKYYKDGYMLTTQKSYSAFSKEAFEAVFETGRQGSSDKERGVYLRTGSDPKNKDHNLDDITWGKTESDITYYLEEDYYYMHGLFSDEISVFMINDETIEKADPVVLNDDGTYSQHFVLDTDDSVWYYQYSMKNHGSLPTYPAFSKVEVTITFDKSFRILSLYSEEQSTVKRAGSNWQNKTSATTTYTYSDMTTAEADIMNGRGWDTIWSEAEPVLSEAKDYFGTWYGKVEPTEATTKEYSPDASDALMGALSGVLSAEGDTYEMKISYEGMDATGYLFASIDLEGWDSLTFDFSDFGIMDWVTFAYEAYEYAHITIAIEDDEGKQALWVDLLPGTGLLDLMGGKVVDVYFSDDLLADSETVAAYADNLVYTAFMSVGEALDAGIKTYADESDDAGMVMTLDYDDVEGRQPARVYLGMSGFEMYVDCYIDKETTGKKKNKTTTYKYELSKMTMSISSMGLDIVLTPDTGDKEAHVTLADDLNDLALDTLVADLVNTALGALDLSSPYYIADSYTLSGNISIDIDLTSFMSSLGVISIDIDNLVITMGDVFDGFYLSFVGELGDSMITKASTIGLTWYDDYIVMARGLETDAPTYRVMTTSAFGEYVLNGDTNISPLAWLLGVGETTMGSIAWAFIPMMFTSTTSLSSSAATATATTDATNLLGWLNLGQYVSSAKVVLDGETRADVGDLDVKETFGFTDDYWAFELGDDFISGITAGYLDSAVVAVTQSMSQLSGIYAVASAFGLINVSLGLSYDGVVKEEYSLFEGNLDIDLENNATLAVPNLYDVFMQGMAQYGLSENDLDFADISGEAVTDSYTTGSILTGDRQTHTITATVDGAFVCYEYTVGNTSYSAIYVYDAVAEDENGDHEISGSITKDHELSNSPDSSENSDD